jgi:uncharacterized protein YggU (UPF0235/DUF167 family)
MSSSAPHFKNGRTGSAITVKVVTHPRQSKITGILGDGTVKIQLAETAGDGQMNESLVRFLAGILEIAPSKIEIVAGKSGPDKLITILDVDSPTVQQRILDHAPH